jgi:azurin
MIMRFGNTIKIVRKKLGEYASYIVEEVVCHNWDISKDKEKMKIFRAGLDAIVDRKMVIHDPLRHIGGVKRGR